MREMHSKRPKFSKFSGGACPRTPLEARALRCSLKTPAASFSISPPTSQILPSTPFLIENPECGDEVEELESAADDGLTDEDDSSTKGDKNTRPENKLTRKRSNAADAIARDKAAKRKTAKMSNKQAVLQSSESLACAIKEMAKGRDEQRKSEIMLWLEHESKERAKDQELETIKLEAIERDKRRKFELEMMRLRTNTGASVPYFTQVQCSIVHIQHLLVLLLSAVMSFLVTMSIEGQLNGTSSGEENTYFRL